MPDVLKESLLHVFATDPVELAKHRLQVVLAVKRKAQELHDAEKHLKQTLEDQVGQVLAPKRLMLWKTLMDETGYHDKAIFDMVCGGIPLYGEHDVPTHPLQTGDLRRIAGLSCMVEKGNPRSKP